MTPEQVLQQFEEAASRMEPRIARAFRAAIEQIRDRGDLDEIAEMLRRNDVRGIRRMFLAEGLSDWQVYEDEIARTAQRGAETAAQMQGTATGPFGEFQVRAPVANPALAEFAHSVAAQRVTGLRRSIINTINRDITAGVVAGDDPFAIARTIRDNIGLTPNQADATRSYERALRNLDRDALGRQLRDSRSDGPLRRAIESGTPLSEARIQSMVARYRARHLKHRSEVISRSESIRSVQGAQHALFEQLVRDGLIDRRQIRREWIVTPDERLRAAHAAIPGLNEGGRGQDEPFVSPLGPILYPGDPDATPANTVNCRCAVFARIVHPSLVGVSSSSPAGALPG